jgi:succinylarginine dihydrolase
VSRVREVNFDGIVGPTHSYAGLSFGNRASMTNAGGAGNPRATALQGLAKARTLLRLGVAQAVLPPQQRPHPAALRHLGMGGDVARALADLQAWRPELLAAVMSASSMWTANAATVSPSADTADGRLHLTPANLISTTHRSFEADQTTAVLRVVFADPDRFVVHDPLPATPAFADEGAANHSRLTTSHDEAGVEVFVYGRDAADVQAGRFPRRQTRLAAEAVARSHGLDPSLVRLVRQSAAAVEAGAFHNDVVSVANESVLLTHEDAFEEPDALVASLPDHVQVVTVAADEVPLDDAIASYLFNSQLVTRPDGTMALVAPLEARATPTTAAAVERILAADNPISEVHHVELRQSMRNGGGPACLRLRVVLTAEEEAALGARVLVDEDRLDTLEAWVRRHYRDRLTAEDLADPALVDESNRALDDLTGLLGLGSVYDFQR